MTMNENRTKDATERLRWDLRARATTTQEAVEALADLLSSSQGIGWLSSNQPNLYRALSKEVRAFTEKWSIPFSIEMMRGTVEMMNVKRWCGENFRDEPKRSDFSNSSEYFEAHEIWNESREHAWLSSSETEYC
jgi:hypothetical protein